MPAGYGRADSPFFDKQNIVLLSTLTLWHAVDAYKTNETIEGGGREVWPVARHFCGSQENRIGYFAGNYAATIGSSYLLHHLGHRRLARLMLIAGSVSSASGFGFTLAHTR